MAREASILGVPSIYCGIRQMAANEIMINRKMLFQLKPVDVPNFVERLLRGEVFVTPQREFINELAMEWIDISQFIFNTIDEWTEKIH